MFRRKLHKPSGNNSQIRPINQNRIRLKNPQRRNTQNKYQMQSKDHLMPKVNYHYNPIHKNTRNFNTLGGYATGTYRFSTASTV